MRSREIIKAEMPYPYTLGQPLEELKQNNLIIELLLDLRDLLEQRLKQ